MKKLSCYKLICLVLTLSILLCLAGCGGELIYDEDNESVIEESILEETDEPESDSTPAEEQEPITHPIEPTIAERLLAQMSLEDKAAQLFIVTPEQLDEAENTTTFSKNNLKYNVGGVVLFSKNIKTRNQCQALINSLQAANKTPMFVSVDEEGGKVARLGNNPDMGTTKFPNMAEIKTKEGAFNVGSTIGKEIKQIGFNLDFAPIADVNSNPHNPIIGVRSFSSDPNLAATQVAAAVEGFHSSGMICTLKHFPGHGDTSTDSHLGYTQEDKTIEQLRETEFIPFISGINAGADFIMVGHISVPEVTGNDLPATLSSVMIDILRNELKFEGLIITDSLRMGAITDRFTSGEAAVESLKAGTDVLLIPENLDGAISGVINAVNNGTLSMARIDQSVLKILETKVKYGIIK